MKTGTAHQPAYTSYERRLARIIKQRMYGLQEWQILYILRKTIEYLEKSRCRRLRLTSKKTQMERGTRSNLPIKMQGLS